MLSRIARAFTPARTRRGTEGGGGGAQEEEEDFDEQEQEQGQGQGQGGCESRGIETDSLTTTGTRSTTRRSGQLDVSVVVATTKEESKTEEEAAADVCNNGLLKTPPVKTVAAATDAADATNEEVQVRQFATTFWETCIDVELRQNIGKSVSCSICQSTLTDPVRTHCCHSFCKGCFQMLLKQMGRNAKCTICNSPVDRRSVEDDVQMEDLALAYKETMKAFGMVPIKHTPTFTTLTQMIPGSNDDDDEYDDAETETKRREKKQKDKLDVLATATTWQVHALPNSKKAQKSHREENNEVVTRNFEAAMSLLAESAEDDHISRDRYGDCNNKFKWDDYLRGTTTTTTGQIRTPQQQTGDNGRSQNDVAHAFTCDNDDNLAAAAAAGIRSHVDDDDKKKKLLDTTDHTTPRMQNTTVLHHDDDDDDDNDQNSSDEDNEVDMLLENPEKQQKHQTTTTTDEESEVAAAAATTAQPLPSTQEIHEQAREQLMADQEMLEAEEDEEKEEDTDAKRKTRRPVDESSSTHNAELQEQDEEIQGESLGFGSAVSSLSQTQGTMETARQEESQGRGQHDDQLPSQQDLSQPLLSQESEHHQDEESDREEAVTKMTKTSQKAISSGYDDLEFRSSGTKSASPSSSPPLFARPSTGSSPCNRHTRKSFSKRDTKTSLAGTGNGEDSAFLTVSKGSKRSTNAATPSTAPLTDIAVRTTTLPRRNSSRGKHNSESPNIPFETSMEMSPIQYMASQQVDEDHFSTHHFRSFTKKQASVYRKEPKNGESDRKPGPDVTGMMEDSMGALHMHHESVLMERKEQGKKIPHEETLFGDESVFEDTYIDRNATSDDVTSDVKPPPHEYDPSEQRKNAPKSTSDRKINSMEKKTSSPQSSGNDGHGPTDEDNEVDVEIPLGQEMLGDDDDDDVEMKDSEHINENDRSIDSDENPKFPTGGDQEDGFNYDPRRASEVTSETYADTKKAVCEAATLPAGHAKSNSRPGKKKLFRQLSGSTPPKNDAATAKEISGAGNRVPPKSAAAKSPSDKTGVDQVVTSSHSSSLMVKSKPRRIDSKTVSLEQTKPELTELLFAVGTVVNVEPRTWPGINKHGGVGRITKMNDDGTYNVSYVLGGKEAGIDAIFIKKTEIDTSDDEHDSKSPSEGSGRRRKRKSRETADEDAIPPDLIQQLAAEGYDVGGLSAPSRQPRKKEPRKKKVSRQNTDALADSTNSSIRTTKSSTSQANPKTKKRKSPQTQAVAATQDNPRDAIQRQVVDDAKKHEQSGTKDSRTRTSTPSIDNLSNEEICKLADDRYRQRIDSALQEKIVNVAASNFSDAETDSLRELCVQIQSTGDAVMKIGGTIGKKTTLVVAPGENGKSKDGDIRARLRTLKAMKATMFGIPIVTPEWINECKKEGKVLVPTRFIRSLPCKIDQFEKNGDINYGAAKIAALWHLQPTKPAIFKNTHIFLCGNYPQQKRNTIVQLLKDGGGKVLHTPSSVPSMLKTSDAHGRVVILCGDSGVSLTKSIEGEIMAALDSQPFDERASFLVVDSTWVFESISCARPLESSEFEPSGAKALWKFSCQL